MRFLLTQEDREEIAQFQLRAACEDCFFFQRKESACIHQWPQEELSINEISFCKEFELR